MSYGSFIIRIYVQHSRNIVNVTMKAAYANVVRTGQTVDIDVWFLTVLKVWLLGSET